MFPVKIFNAKGKKVGEISAEKLREDMWNRIDRISMNGVINHQAPDLTKKCQSCKKLFTTWDPRLKVCGEKCRDARAQKQRKMSPSQELIKKERREETAKNKKCKQCGTAYKSARKNKIFCRYECNILFHRAARTVTRRENSNAGAKK